MLSEVDKKDLEDQHYRVVGSHSAVKICHWTKQMLTDKGECYKHMFYGIRSNQCMQMTTSISCANRCIFCWRGYKSPVSKEWKWDIDDPKEILEGSIAAHTKLLIGYGGNDKVNPKMLGESKTVKHVALSLTGEPIMYPKINEFIKLCNEKGISTFLVTNGQYPEQIKELLPVTQLYISVDAANKEMMKKIDVPLFKDYWERMEKSLEYMKEKNHRTAIRLTVIKDMNDSDLDGYVKLIEKGDPDFIEVKAYMFIGESRKRLEEKNMPYHDYVVEFAEKLAEKLSGYSIISQHKSSRVVLLAKESFKKKDGWHTWIDFDKWQKGEGKKEGEEGRKKGEEGEEKVYNKKTPEEYIIF